MSNLDSSIDMDDNNILSKSVSTSINDITCSITNISLSQTRNFLTIGSTIAVPSQKNVLDDCIDIDVAFDKKRIKVKKSVVMRILGMRTLEQRLQIVDLYERIYRKNLVIRFEQNFCGQFGFIMIALLTDGNTFQAQLLYKAIKAKNIEAIIFMICARSPIDLKRIKVKYESMYSRDCVSDIIQVIKDPRLKNLLSLILVESRNENFKFLDYEEFFKQNCLQGNESLFLTTSPELINNTFALSNLSYLNLLFRYFEQSTGSTIEQRMREVFQRGSYLLALIIIYKYVNNNDLCFCDIFHNLYNTGSHMGVIAFIIEHCELDLSRIIELHNNKFKLNFGEKIRRLFKGNSREILLLLSNYGQPNNQVIDR